MTTIVDRIMCAAGEHAFQWLCSDYRCDMVRCVHCDTAASWGGPFDGGGGTKLDASGRCGMACVDACRDL